MKKFILKSSFFVTPIIGLYIFFVLFYSTDKGDLLRVGYVMDNSGYDRKLVFQNEFKNKIYYTNLSDINLKSKREYTVLTIGDSFSDQYSIGYKNYLAENDHISVIHFDGFLHTNPIQTLNGILNGDILDSVKVKYIILESIEREFVQRGKRISESKISTSSVRDSILKHSLHVNTPDEKKNFFSREMFTFAFNNIFYTLDDNAYHSQVYSVKTTGNLFSVSKNKLLFYDQDLIAVRVNNEPENILSLNEVLNRLSGKLNKKGIKLIVLPCPDKFDFYYDRIVDSVRYPKPLFFERFDTCSKNYLYLNSKEILKSETTNEKDIYFYDDTHWSPKAAKIIAKALAKLIEPAGKEK